MIKKIFVLLLIPVFLLAFISLKKANNTAKKFGTNLATLSRLIYTSYAQAQGMDLRNYKKIGFIFLGQDPRNDFLEQTQVTDTIIFGQLNFSTNKIHLVSLPRDTWLAKYKFKLNRLYPYILEKYPDNWGLQLKQEFAQILGQDVDHIIKLDTQTFQQISSAIGPVTINLPYSFTDDQYPNPDYIKSPTPNTPIYKTISFTSGLNEINSSNVLEFVRSRKGSSDPTQGGTDLGRIGRQHLLIQAYISKMIQSKNLDQLAQLYQIYLNQLSQDLSLENIMIYYFSFLNSSDIKIEFVTLPTSGPQAIISDPGVLVEKQSVLLPSDPEFKSLQKFILDNF